MAQVRQGLEGHKAREVEDREEDREEEEVEDQGQDEVTADEDGDEGGGEVVDVGVEGTGEVRIWH